MRWSHGRSWGETKHKIPFFNSSSFFIHIFKRNFSMSAVHNLSSAFTVNRDVQLLQWQSYITHTIRHALHLSCVWRPPSKAMDVLFKDISCLFVKSLPSSCLSLTLFLAPWFCSLCLFPTVLRSYPVAQGSYPQSWTVNKKKNRKDTRLVRKYLKKITFEWWVLSLCSTALYAVILMLSSVDSILFTKCPLYYIMPVLSSVDSITSALLQYCIW